MRYQVWVEIEGVPSSEADENQPNGGYASGGDFGILPDPLGEYATLGEAVRLQAAVVATYNPATMGESDAVAYVSNSEERLNAALTSEVWEQ